jgi:hypothetical protein
VPSAVGLTDYVAIRWKTPIQTRGQVAYRLCGLMVGLPVSQFYLQFLSLDPNEALV